MPTKTQKTVLYQNAAAAAGDSAVAKCNNRMLLSIEGDGVSFYGATITVLVKPPGMSQFQQIHFADNTVMQFTAPFVDTPLDFVPFGSDLKLNMTGGNSGGTTDITAILYEV